MTLQKKTMRGTLMAGYRPDCDTYPGFWVNLFRKNRPSLPICIVEYEPFKKCIQVVVYGDTNSDEPTHIIPIK